jgi:hypothetical protein
MVTKFGISINTVATAPFTKGKINHGSDSLSHVNSGFNTNHDILICNPNSITEAMVERTIAAAAEKPFMMLSVYLTTTEVYRPPTLART